MKRNFDRIIEESVASIAQHWNRRPRFGIVLGTGAGIVADHISAEATLPYGSIANFPVSTATGHRGNLVCGSLDGHAVVAMQGRFHLYEGYDVDLATLPIHVMQALGVEVLFISNAAGGLNSNFVAGDVMALDSHLDFMNRSTLEMSPKPSGNQPFDQPFDRPVIRSDQAYDPILIAAAMAHARRSGFVLHRGVYAAMLGPNYETRAEYRMLRRVGADVAGMSTVPEATVAARYGIRVLAISIVTNVAKPDVLESTSGEEVIDAAEIAAPKLKSIVSAVIESAAS